MKNKKNIIGIGMLIIILVIFLIIFIVFLKKNNDKKVDIYKDQAIEYFNDTKSMETSIWALLENGYLNETKNDKCDIIKLNNDEIEVVSNDCTKAENYAKKPVIIIESTNDFKIDSWNNIETKLTLKLKNDGNSYYSQDDITSIIWESTSEGIISTTNEVALKKENTFQNLKVYVQFKDGDLNNEYSFQIKIDTEIPVIDIKTIENGKIYVSYQDHSGIEKIYYYFGQENIVPKKDIMTEDKDYKYECNKKYYIYSYAVDLAGNESNVEYIGEYNHKCDSISLESTNEN